MGGNSIYSEIRKARILKGYSQEYMGTQLGITQNYYSKIERAQCKITLDMLLAVCTVLEISPVDLFLASEKREVIGNP